MKSKELALISIFSSLWIATQIVLGPVIGRLSIGPISFHGVVNRLVGWMLMLILAKITGKFGNVSIMSIIAAIGTRIIRMSPLSGFVTGIGYSLGGFIFDVIFFHQYKDNRYPEEPIFSLIFLAFISGLITSLPHIIYKNMILSYEVFILYIPVFIASTLKGATFSIIGSWMGVLLFKRFKSMEVIFTLSTPSRTKEKRKH